MIELVNLEKFYDGKRALRRVSVRIPSASTLSVSGPSGSGKTTLLRLMLGLERADGGEMRGLQDLKARAVFQEDRLIEHLSAHQNIALALKSDVDMGIGALLTSLGLPERDEKPVSTYSGGMRRRVAIARALACKPELLLLDEPFTGLDDASKALAISAILDRKKGATIILVTHNPDDAHALLSTNALTLCAD